ncbi:MAG: ATP-binding protein [Spirochaetaceae bacterium]|nr:ATP-binding protein [Spirochaetaceae bacterium]MCF7939019.1 ATP-binding protein [Spirochaetales bacterium]
MQHMQAVFVAGPPACGKTTFARELARRLNAALFDLDTLSEPFLRSYLQKQPSYKDSHEYKDTMRDREYEALMQLVEDNLKIGVNCVAVAPFTKEKAISGFPWHRWKASGIYDAAVKSFGIAIEITSEQQLRNLQSRGAMRDKEKIERWDKYSLAVTERENADGASWGVDVRLTVEFEDLINNFSNEVDRISAIITQAVYKPE